MKKISQLRFSKIESFEKSIKACVRTISNGKISNVFFEGNDVLLDNNTAIFPKFSKNLSLKNIFLIRGFSDFVSFYSILHNTKIHKIYSPKEQQSKDLFDNIERIRIEAIGSRMKGVSKNLRYVAHDRYKKFFNQEFEKSNLNTLNVVLELIIREKIMDFKIPKKFQSLIGFLKKNIEEKISNYLIMLCDVISYQDKFSIIVRNILYCMNISSQSEKNVDQKFKGQKLSKIYFKNNNFINVFQNALSNQIFSSKENSENINNFNNYKIYTRSFDKIVQVKNLSNSLESIQLQEILNNESNFLDISKRIGNRLKRQLMSKQKYFWEFNLDEGQIDTNHLLQIIIDPICPLLYKREKYSIIFDTVVAILIDNSGSMRGKPIVAAITCANIISKIFEICNIKIEVLGFTTTSWKGGKSRKKWIDYYQPSNPGRLNDLLHIIYKNSDMPWRKAQHQLSFMMKEENLKENIDGEALIWAYERLLKRQENRRILIVISDGAPIDDSTLEENSKSYLVEHLQSVIQEIEKYSFVDLIAIGIGYDVTQYYKNSVTIENIENLTSSVIEKIINLFNKIKFAN